MVTARRSAAQSCQPPPPLVCLEINEVGIKMSERTQVINQVDSDRLQKNGDWLASYYQQS